MQYQNMPPTPEPSEAGKDSARDGEEAAEGEEGEGADGEKKEGEEESQPPEKGDTIEFTWQFCADIFYLIFMIVAVAIQFIFQCFNSRWL